MSDLFWLTEPQMERQHPFFPKSHGRPRVDDRRELSGVIFIIRNGLRWRDGVVGGRGRNTALESRYPVSIKPAWKRMDYT